MRRAWMPPPVGIDVDRRRAGIEVDQLLLRREHRDILQERGLDLLEHALGHLRILRLEVVRLRPEIMRRGLGLRRHGIEVAHLDAADAAAFRRAGAGRRRADVEPDERRRHEVDDLPAVDVAGEAADLDERRRRRLVDDPARHLHAVRRALHPHRGVLHQRHVADGGLMHEGEMREIEQVVVDELPVALGVEIVGLGAPVRDRRANDSRGSSTGSASAGSPIQIHSHL